MPYKDPQKQKDWYTKNKARIIAKVGLVYQKNKEAKKEYARRYYSKNRERQIELNKVWREEHKGEYKKLAYFHCAKRRANIRNLIPDNADMNKIKQFYVLAERLTYETDIKYCVDHIKPVSKGGLHHQDNLQVITVVDNLRKGNKYPFKVEMYFNPDFAWITHI